MGAVLDPQLVNGETGDPALFVDLPGRKRALLIDLGDLAALAPRALLRVSDIFVSHCHMDHFVGFDAFLRIALGRGSIVHLYGPPGFVGRVEAKLAAYDWNLVGNYEADLVLEAMEVAPDGAAQRARFRLKEAFRREAMEPIQVTGGVVLDDEVVRVCCAFLDHRIASLGFAVEAKPAWNVDRERVAELGLPTGPWLRELKAAAAAEVPRDARFEVVWSEEGAACRRVFPLGALRDALLTPAARDKIAYVTDCIYHEENARRIVEMGSGATTFFIEAVFLQRDATLAADKYHLTAAQAGRLARGAGAAAVAPFHFSNRYGNDYTELMEEVRAAFRGKD